MGVVCPRPVISTLIRRLLRLVPVLVAGNASFVAASLLASRVLSSADFALYSAQVGFVAVAATGVSGLQLDLAHAVAGREKKPEWHRSKLNLGLVGFGLLLTLGVAATLPLLTRLWKVNFSDVVVLVVVPLFVLTAAAVSGVLQGSRRFGPWFGFSAILGAWRIVVLLIAFVAVLSVEVIVALLLLGSSAIAAVYFRESSLRDFVRNWRVSRRFLTLSVISIAMWAMVYADLMLVRRFADPNLSGALAALLTVAKGVLFVPILIGQLMFPELINLGDALESKAYEVRRLALIVGLIGLVGTVALGVAGTWILSDVYGMNILPPVGIIWMVSASIISFSLLIVIGNFAMAAVSSLFAAGFAVATLLHYYIGIFLAENVEQVLLSSILLPVVIGCVFFALDSKIA